MNHEILLNPRWPAEDLRLLRETAESVLSERMSESSYVLSSSGTSAGAWRAIKLIVLPRRSVEASARAVNRRFGLGPSDRLAQMLPSFHVGGLGLETRARLCGAECLPLFDGEGKWDPLHFAREARARRISVVSLVPTQLHDLLLQAPAPWPELRCVWLGGAALAPALEREARAKGWPLVLTYGMTETASMIAVREEADESRGFEVLPHARVDLTADGRLRIQASSLASGYARRTSEGAIEWTPISAEGYVTEDHGEIRDGRLFVSGRGGDQIKINGENVNLSVLRAILEEEALRLGLAPADVYLIARPDERRGASLSLVLRAGLESRELRSCYEGRVLPFERFSEVIEIEAIPRTELGKVREAELIAALRARGR